MKRENRVSLVEVSKARDGMLPPGDSSTLTDAAAPTLRDLSECLFFSPGEGASGWTISAWC